jgi:hypothetical protein
MLAGLLAAIPSLACAPVPGEGRFVRIDTEEAFIVWDQGAKREHFIRRAAFDTDAKDFGFLVPTPSRPELAEAEDATFATLGSITGGGPHEKSVSAVTVLEQKVVSGFDAAVLEATDATSLDGWLKEHGYPSSPELVDWYRPYVENGWKVTAFKIAAGTPTVTTKPVRMSFQTERPFFPYREPLSKAKGKGERLLRVYFLADARFEGAVAGGSPWPGAPVWSNAITEEDRLKLLKVAGLPIMAGGGGRWLTEFEDRASPRSGADELYFSRVAGTSTALTPEPGTQRQPWKWAIVGLMVALAAYGLWRLLRRRNG